MTPDVFSSLINLGAAGAVIIVVWKFLDHIQKANEQRREDDAKRDSEWRGFFVTLNSTNKEDVKQLASMMERMVNTLDMHDAQAKEIQRAVAIIDQNTRPLPGRPGYERRGPNK